MNTIFKVSFILTTLSLIQCADLWGLKDCGTTKLRATERVIGGRDANIEEFPWQVSLQRITLGSVLPIPEWRHLCGGSIVSKRWILTAAHCVEGIVLALYPGQLRAVIGSSHWRNALYQRGTQIIPISEIIVHEDWNRDEGLNDIALLKTQYPIDFISTENQVKVNSVCFVQNMDDFNGTAVLSGWGLTGRGLLRSRLPNQLQKIEVPIIESEICKRLFAKGDIQLNDKHICAGQYKNGYCEGANSGDSGGALIQYINDRAVQVGLVSFSLPCRTYQPPDVYTKISKYVDWIEKKVKEA